MKRYVLIGAMNEEIAPFERIYQPQKEEKYTSDVKKIYLNDTCEVLVVKSGIGKVNAARALTEVLCQTAVSGVLNVGSAGSISDDLPPQSYCSIERCYSHDIDVTAFGYQQGQMAGEPLFFETDPALTDCIIEVLKTQGCRVQSGDVATGDAFIASSEKVLEIHSHFQTVQCLEMEAYSYASVAHYFNVPFAVLKCISDDANGSASIDFNMHIQSVGEELASVLPHIFEALTAKGETV